MNKIETLRKGGRAMRSLPSRKAWISEAWCRETESNHRHEALQASALPLSYPGVNAFQKFSISL